MNYSMLEIPTGSEKKEGVLEMLTRLETLHNIWLPKVEIR